MTNAYSEIVREDIDYLLTDLQDVLPRFAGANVLITGASGFLMSYLVETLIAWNVSKAGEPCRVIALDNFKTGLPERLEHLEGAPGFELLKHDICDPLSLDFPVHWIVHGASIASPTVYRQYPLETIRANVDGTHHLLELARKNPVSGVVIMSTSEIYGDPDPAFIPTPETYRGYVSCTGPRACYDESKRMAETLAMTYYRLYETPIKVIRPFNFYGPGLRLDDLRVLPDFVTCVLGNRPIELLSTGTPTRSFCYIRDAVALMFRMFAADTAGEPLNVGNDEAEISMLDLANAVSRIGAKTLDSEPVRVKHATSDDADYLVDNPQRRCPSLAKARELFPDWAPRVGIDEGIERYFRHVIERENAND